MTLGHYVQLLRPHLAGVLLSTLLLGITAALPGLGVLVLREALDEVWSGRPGSRLGWLCAGLVGLTVLEGISGIARARLTKGIAWRVTSDLRRALHRHLARLSSRQRDGIGASLAALTHDVDELQYGVSALVTAIRNPLSLCVLMAVALSLAPGLAAWGLLGIPILIGTGRAAGRLLQRRARTQRQARSRLLVTAQEQLQGLPVIQDFSAEEAEHQRFVAIEEADRVARLRLDVDRMVPSIAARTVVVCGLAVLLWVGAHQVLDGTLDPSSLVAFAVALGLMSRPLGGLTEVWSLMQRSLAALERVGEVLQIPPEPQVSSPLASLPDGSLPLRWEGVSAGYDASNVLFDVSLEARVGEILALVGPTGAGKSSLLALVGRQLDPRGGRVRLGGIDVRHLPLPDLRGAIGRVRQEGFLFGRTVAENVAMGRPGVSEAALHEALTLAGADFVRSLPQGIHTVLAEGGLSLSGGERQRLCLARALLTRPPVLLLDEATNQVDPETERALMRRLRGLAPGRVVVMVAHDPVVARMADRVAVLDQGRVVEQGDPAELWRGAGWFGRWRSEDESARLVTEIPSGGRSPPSAVGSDNQE